MSVPKETKNINVKVFNMVTKKDEAKAMIEHISCDCKCKFNNTTCGSNQEWNNKTCRCECKNYCKCKIDCSWNPSQYIGETSKCLKSIADTSVTDFNEIIFVMDIVSAKKTNIIAAKKANVSSTALSNYHSKKRKRMLYFAYIIDYHIAIDNYYYLLSLCKAKRYSIGK